MTFRNQLQLISRKIRVAGKWLNFNTLEYPQSKIPIRLPRSVFLILSNVDLITFFSLRHSVVLLWTWVCFFVKKSGDQLICVPAMCIFCSDFLRFDVMKESSSFLSKIFTNFWWTFWTKWFSSHANLLEKIWTSFKHVRNWCFRSV